MFERWKLARLWREGHNFCVLLRVASVTENNADAVVQLQSGLFGVSKLSWLGELCEPLMIMYAQQLPAASSINQDRIRGLSHVEWEMDLHRTSGRLLRNIQVWKTKVTPKKQINTLLGVLGARGYIHAGDIDTLFGVLKDIYLRGSSIEATIGSGFNQRTG